MFDKEKNENQSIFSVDMDYEEIIEVPDEYLQVRLSELLDGEVFTGTPQVSGIITTEFETDDLDDNGNHITKTVHKLRLVLVDDEGEQYLDININLKKPSYDVVSIRTGSVLFDMVQSILEIENKGSTKGKNVFRNVNLKQFTDFINNNVKVMSVKNIERKGRYNFNSFYIVKLNDMELNI